MSIAYLFRETTASEDTHYLFPRQKDHYPIESKPLLKLKEAQALTGLSREKLIDAIEVGKLHAVARDTPRAPYRVKRSALDAYIEKNF